MSGCEKRQDMSGWEYSDGRWLHRPWWKVAINTVLRWLQPWTARKWVVYSVCTAEGAPPRVLGYGFGRVRHVEGK